MKDREIAKALNADAETPLRNLKPYSSSIQTRRRQTHGRHRLPALAEKLRAAPDDPAWQELFIENLISRTQRQVRAKLCLFKTFVETVDDLDADTRAVLPKPLFTLVELARKRPVHAAQARLWAHALVLNGALVECLHSQTWRGVLGAHEDAESVRKAYRKLRRKHHPDHGGDAAKFQQIQHAWREARAELEA